MILLYTPIKTIKEKIFTHLKPKYLETFFFYSYIAYRHHTGKDTESLNLSPTKQKKPVRILTGFVRTTGLEPTRRKTLDPKSSAATNYATSANDGTNIREVYKLYNY